MSASVGHAVTVADPAVPLLARLHAAGGRTLGALSSDEARRQYHPDLSPIAWHIGHCAFVETYWIREIALDDHTATRDHHALYWPESAPKDSRGGRMPSSAMLLEWTSCLHRGNLERLADPPARASAGSLIRSRYLRDFLAQHYAQHLETMDWALAQMYLARADGHTDVTAPSFEADHTGWDFVGAGAGPHHVGSEAVQAYDNEQPVRQVSELLGSVARRPVTNAQYLAFMEAGGYVADRFWSDAGRSWLRSSRVVAPSLWRRTRAGRWYGIDHTGAHRLLAGDPVRGVSQFEAEAFASWAGYRLPHEYEWECLARRGVLEGIGGAWEWCGNALHGYPGFRPFPYDGYSLPWFDEAHYVLKGGSASTWPCIRRPSFRNFFQRDKRHLYAGLRLAHD